MRAILAALLLVITVSAALSQEGMASWYHEGQRVACHNGRFNPEAMTAAHPSLPCGTKIKVTNKKNGKSVFLTVNDRGPFVRNRIVDVSRAAARTLGMMGAGVVPVTLDIM